MICAQNHDHLPTRDLYTQDLYECGSDLTHEYLVLPIIERETILKCQGTVKLLNILILGYHINYYPRVETMMHS